MSELNFNDCRFKISVDNLLKCLCLSKHMLNNIYATVNIYVFVGIYVKRKFGCQLKRSFLWMAPDDQEKGKDVKFFSTSLSYSQNADMAVGREFRRLPR